MPPTLAYSIAHDPHRHRRPRSARGAGRPSAPRLRPHPGHARHRPGAGGWHARAAARWPRRVDPRVRGGGSAARNRRGHGRGRSPRARGRRQLDFLGAAQQGSIPACAGEASTGGSRRHRRRVDPRVRGGGGWSLCSRSPSQGRSPRARGRPLVQHVGGAAHGSIPACAGEADQYVSHDLAPQVDPRVRGGGQDVTRSALIAAGRSPRARGRPTYSRRADWLIGSIPACAGEAG